MNFSIFGIEVSLKKKRSSKYLNLEGINLINNDSLAYIKSLSSEELARRNSLVSFPNLSDYDLIKDKLDSSGIVIVENFLSKKQVNIIRDTITLLLDSVKEFIESGSRLLENDNVLFQFSNEKLKGYSQLSGYGKTVVSVRQGQDEGMIDVFNVDYAFSNLKKELRSH